MYKLQDKEIERRVTSRRKPTKRRKQDNRTEEQKRIDEFSYVMGTELIILWAFCLTLDVLRSYGYFCL